MPLLPICTLDKSIPAIFLSLTYISLGGFWYASIWYSLRILAITEQVSSIRFCLKLFDEPRIILNVKSL